MLCAHTAFAGFFTGNDLKKWADAYNRIAQGTGAGNDNRWASYFQGYVIGVADASEGDLICVPTGTSTAQLTAMVVKFLNDHPEAWGKSASILVMYSLVPDFPCNKK
ncbi:MAG: hypothetical protein IPH54_14695 [Rhodoferax sp.]|nr:hypothetical protein [Rhodoferax sp.]